MLLNVTCQIVWFWIRKETPGMFAALNRFSFYNLQVTGKRFTTCVWFSKFSFLLVLL